MCLLTLRDSSSTTGGGYASASSSRAARDFNFVHACFRFSRSNSTAEISRLSMHTRFPNSLAHILFGGSGAQHTLWDMHMDPHFFRHSPPADLK